jgi:hypothetical protein
MLTPKELVDSLTRLGLDDRSTPALALLPLVEIAWADGSVQALEKELIRRAAEDYGVVGAASRRVLDRWLADRPSPETFALGRRVLAELVGESREGHSVSVSDPDELLDLCQDVARAAGDLLGDGSTVEPREWQALAVIARSLYGV